MSFTRNFQAKIQNPDRDSTLGHAYPNNHILIQEKLEDNPINNIFYIDNEIPHIPTEDEIFKINYPIGSIYITRTPISQYGAVLLQNTDPHDIRYKWHDCTFRYLYMDAQPSSVHKQVYLAGGQVKQNSDNTYTEKFQYSGGTNQNTVYLIGDNYVQPHTLTIEEMPSHNHVSGGWDSLKTDNGHLYRDLIAFNGGNLANTGSTGGLNGETQPHSHSFSASYPVPINPPYIGVLFYQRII